MIEPKQISIKANLICSLCDRRSACDDYGHPVECGTATQADIGTSASNEDGGEVRNSYFAPLFGQDVSDTVSLILGCLIGAGIVTLVLVNVVRWLSGG